MAADSVIVACKLPNGIVLEHPTNPDVKVAIAGLNSTVLDVDHVTTRVDGDFWADWIKANASFGPVLSGAIFADKTAASVGAIAKESKKRKTGFEPMQTDGKDPRASGVKSVKDGDKGEE